MYNYFLTLLVCATMQKKKKTKNIRCTNQVKTSAELFTVHSLCKIGGGGVLSYMGHIGMYRCEVYGFQSVYSSMHRVYK